jgi:hypothetical protein
MSRYLVLGAAVLGLALLNLWNWKAKPGAGPERAAAAAAFRPEEFRLRAAADAGERAQPGRNLFQPRLPPPARSAPVAAAAPVEAPPAPPPGPPPKSPEELAEEAARDELRQIRLVGVVFRGGVGEAFLVKGDQVFLVRSGGRVGERFRVESIAPEGIQLSDPASRVHGQIPVSGK